MTIDRGRAMLIAAGAFTVLAWGYKLWPSGTAAPNRPAFVAAAAAAQPAAAAATAPPPPPPPLSPAEVKTWAGLYRVVRRDPFFTAAEIAAMNRPPVVEAPPVVPVAAPPPRPARPAYTVTLVMTAGSERFASIGDRVVKVGDMLGEERVAQILPDAVVLERGGERRRLELATGDSSGLIHIERVR